MTKIMEAQTGKTAKLLRDKQGVPEKAKENLKEFVRIKKALIEALKNGEMTIPQLSEKLSMSKEDVTFYLMTLVKYGDVAVGEIDDNDEYFTYKLNK
jgi:DNA-directed RNA polymerase specialized sigma subunit